MVSSIARISNSHLETWILNDTENGWKQDFDLCPSHAKPNYYCAGLKILNMYYSAYWLYFFFSPYAIIYLMSICFSSYSFSVSYIIPVSPTETLLCRVPLKALIIGSSSPHCANAKCPCHPLINTSKDSCSNLLSTVATILHPYIPTFVYLSFSFSQNDTAFTFLN